MLNSLRLRPVIVESEIRAHWKSGIEDATETSNSRGKFRYDGNRYSFLRDMNQRNPPNQMESIYDHGELIRIIEIRIPLYKLKPGQRVVDWERQFESPKTGAASIEPGKVVTSMHFPVAGCLDGYFLSDYFTSESKLEKNSKELVLRCTTSLGDAVCAFTPSDLKVPSRVEITKTADHDSAGSRKVRDIVYVSSEPKSRLNKKVILLSNITGNGVIDSCTLIQEDYSERGLEGTHEYQYRVTSRDTDPEFPNDQLQPELAVRNGDPFQAIGADQLPFVWSSKVNWVVPE